MDCEVAHHRLLEPRSSELVAVDVNFCEIYHTTGNYSNQSELRLLNTRVCWQCCGRVDDGYGVDNTYMVVAGTNNSSNVVVECQVAVNRNTKDANLFRVWYKSVSKLQSRCSIKLSQSLPGTRNKSFSLCRI